jgi:hypothetical protein
MLLGVVFNFLLATVVTLKHEAFHEEREWRVIYSPKRLPSQLMEQGTETIHGVPQIIHKIPLTGPPPDDLAGLDIPSMLDRVIIGPTQYAGPMWEAFCPDTDRCRHCRRWLARVRLQHSHKNLARPTWLAL